MRALWGWGLRSPPRRAGRGGSRPPCGHPKKIYAIKQRGRASGPQPTHLQLTYYSRPDRALLFPGGKGRGWERGRVVVGGYCHRLALLTRAVHTLMAGRPASPFAYWGRAYLFEKMPLRPVGPWGPRQVGSRPVRFSASAPFLKLIRLDELALILRVVVVLRWAEHWVARTL